MKVLLLNDTTKWYHFGCTATSTALKETITDLGFELTAVPITESYKITDILKTWAEFQDTAKFEVFNKANSELMAQIDNTDIVMINGEGTLHGVRPAPLGLLYIAYAAKQFLKKNVQIINHSVYPQNDLSVTDPSIVNLYKQVYNVLDFAAIREPLSFKLMRSLDIACVESFDCTPLYIKNHYKKVGAKNDEKILLIAGSATWLNLNILAMDKGNIEEFENGLKQFIAYIDEMATRGYQIKFLYGAEQYPSKDDQELIAFIEPRLKSPWQVVTAKSLTEWLNIIEQATLLVSGRFHHSLAAACLGTPFISLNSNTPKVYGLMMALNHKPCLAYDDSNLTNKLLKLTDNMLETNGDADRLLEELCTKATANFNGL